MKKNILLFVGGLVLGALLIFIIINSFDVKDPEFEKEKARLNDSLKVLNNKINFLEKEGKILEIRLLQLSKNIDSLKGGLGKSDSAVIILPPQEEIEAYLDSIINLSKE